MPKNSSGLGRQLIKAHKKKGNYVAYEGFVRIIGFCILKRIR